MRGFHVKNLYKHTTECRDDEMGIDGIIVLSPAPEFPSSLINCQ